MGEMQESEYINKVAIEDYEEDKCLRQHLAQHSHPDVITRQSHQRFAAVELHFRTYGIGGNKKYEKQQHSWHHECREIDVIVCPRVAYHVKIDGCGLQERRYLLVGIASGAHRGLPYSSRTKCAHRLHVAKE